MSICFDRSLMIELDAKSIVSSLSMNTGSGSGAVFSIGSSWRREIQIASLEA